jgi:hypothetical protein
VSLDPSITVLEYLARPEGTAALEYVKRWAAWAGTTCPVLTVKAAR